MATFDRGTSETNSIDFSDCYRKLIALYRSREPWRLLFNSHRPVSRSEHILCVDANKYRIAEIASEIGVRAADCLASAKAMTNCEVIAYRAWKAEESKHCTSLSDIFRDESLNLDQKRDLLTQNSEARTNHRSREPRVAAATYHIIRSMERAGTAGESLSTRAFERLAWSDMKLSWTMIQQSDLMTEVEVGCRDACEVIGRAVGKAIHEVRREMTLERATESFETREDEIDFVASRLDGQYRRWFLHLARKRYPMEIYDFLNGEDRNGNALTNAQATSLEAMFRAFSSQLEPFGWIASASRNSDSVKVEKL